MGVEFVDENDDPQLHGLVLEHIILVFMNGVLMDLAYVMRGFLYTMKNE